MSEISSGLVAVAWMTDEPQMLFFCKAEAESYCDDGEPIKLVRLSDAEAIISKHAERIKELESDVDEEAHIRDRMAHLLAETAVALKGPEKALHRHGWQDLPEVATKQSAALKLAKDALYTIRNRFNWADYSGSLEWRTRNEAREALAAIDALGEVK